MIGIIDSWGMGPQLSSDYQMISIPHFRSVIVEVMLLAWLPPDEPFHAEQKAKHTFGLSKLLSEFGIKLTRKGIDACHDVLRSKVW